jgi:biopolymer transport protein ExbB
MSGKIIISIFDSIPLWVMLLPIFICSITVFAVFIERIIFYKNIRMDYRLLVSGISAKLREGSLESAMAICAPYRGPLIEMIKKMLLYWNDAGDAELRIRDPAETTIRSIERFANLTATIGTVSPMLGLLGTVTGMMKSFSGLANMAPTSDLLAQGITEALITTALGLMVAIPSIIFYNYLVSKAETYTREIEYIANIFFESKSK